MRLNTDDQYAEMDDDQQREAEYKIALQIQKEQEKNSIFNQRVEKRATREEIEEQRKKNMAEWAARVAELEAMDDEPIVAPTPKRLSKKEQMEQEFAELLAAEEISERMAAIPKEISKDMAVENSRKTSESPQDKNTLEVESKGVSVNVRLKEFLTFTKTAKLTKRPTPKERPSEPRNATNYKDN